MRSGIYNAALGILTVGAVCLLGQLNWVQAEPTSQPASQPTTAAAAINWDEAVKHVGETITVTGPVIGTHLSTNGKTLSLNIGKDFPDPTRFTVLIKGTASADDYKDKTVTVTGKVELYKEVAEIKVKPEDVQIAK